jgi:hypothetical protein
LENLIDSSQLSFLVQNKTMVDAEDYDTLFTPHVQNFTMYFKLVLDGANNLTAVPFKLQ